MKQLLIATNNSYKREQFKYLLKDFDLNLKTLEDFSFNEKPDEDKDTARENALLKARFWCKKIKIPTLGDDAGLEIDALNGEPGIKARRWAGLFDDSVSDKEWLTYLLKRMEGVPFEKRTAKFRAAWAVVFPNGKEIVKDIILPFHILEEPRDDYPKGSPISAVRFDTDFNKMEMDLTKKEQWCKLKKEMDSWKDFIDQFC